MKRSASRPGIAVIATFLGLTIAIGLLATFGIGHRAELAILKTLAFREGVTSDLLILVAQWVSWVGDTAQRTLEVILFAGWLLWRRRNIAALVMLVISPLTGATSSLLKEAFGRARPEIVPHLDLVTSLSYPSGHAANAMATLVLAVLLINPVRRSYWLAVATLSAIIIGGSRIVLAVHWPSDVLGGWFWGAGFALLGLWIVEKQEALSKSEANADPDVPAP